MGTRSNSYESSGKESGSIPAHFASEEVGCEGSESTESRGEKDTDIANVDWETDHLEKLVDDARCNHKSWVECSSGDPA